MVTVKSAEARYAFQVLQQGTFSMLKQFILACSNPVLQAPIA
jgi:hypothetical protein